MYNALLSVVTTLLNPTNRVRMHSLLLLTTLVVMLLCADSHPQLASVASFLFGDRYDHAAKYGVLGALCWIALGGRSPGGALVLSGSIALLEEGMRFHAPGGTAEFPSVVADLIGATAVGVALTAAKAAEAKRGDPAMRRHAAEQAFSPRSVASLNSDRAAELSVPDAQ
jgi:VanZ family protein